MEIKFTADSTSEEIEAVKKRFSSGGYELSLSEQTLIVSGRNITDAIMNEVRIFKGVADAKLLKHWVETTFLAKKINLGLDLQGGMHLVLQANFEGIQNKIGRELTEKDRNEIAQQALELLRNRIDKFGVSEPSIRPRGNEAIEIQLPGVKDPSV
jgi:preprotein translocase subunit SecD